MALTEDEKLQRLLAEKRHEQSVALLEMLSKQLEMILEELKKGK